MPVTSMLVALALLTFFATDSTLPILLLLALALGNSNRWMVAQKSFYLRFFVLGLFAARGCFLFLRTRVAGVATPGFGMTLVQMLLLFVGIYGVIGSPASVDPAVSAHRAASFLLLFLVIFLYFRIRAVSSERCADWAVALWCSLAIFLGLGFLMWVAGVPGMVLRGRLRLAIGNPNQLGHCCALLMPIAAWYALDRAKGIGKFLAWAVLGMSAAAIFLSGSRGALAAALGGLLVQFGLCYREKALPLLFAAALAVPIYFLRNDPPWQGRYDPSFFEQTVVRTYSLSTGTGRVDVWRSAKLLIDSRPFTGYGFGSVDRLFGLRYFSNVPSYFRGPHVHNGYLEELVNLGWIGASSVFLAIGYLLMFGFWVMVKPVARTANYRLSCALFGVLVAGAASGVTESWFTSVGSLFCFSFWFCGMLLLKMIRHFNDWRLPLSLRRA